MKPTNIFTLVTSTLDLAVIVEKTISAAYASVWLLAHEAQAMPRCFISMMNWIRQRQSPPRVNFP